MTVFFLNSSVVSTPKVDVLITVILTLQQFNEFTEHHHFKMDTGKDAIQLMQPGCYFASRFQICILFSFDST